MMIYRTLLSNIENLTLKPNSPVIRQKGESQNGYFKKTKLAKVSEKRTFLIPWYARSIFSRILAEYGECAYQEVKKCSFFGEFGVLCFFETPVLRFAFFLITDKLQQASRLKPSSDVKFDHETLTKFKHCIYINIGFLRFVMFVD